MLHRAPRRDVSKSAKKNHVNAAELDQVVGSWLFSQLQAGNLSPEELVLALDTKSLRGALRSDARAVHLFSAMRQSTDVVVAQEEVEKLSNKIAALARYSRTSTSPGRSSQRTRCMSRKGRCSAKQPKRVCRECERR